MKTSNKTIALALSGAFALSVGATTVNAAENPFAIKALSSGYQVADADSKAKEGSCAEGKCSTEMKKDHAKAKDGKCGEGKCSAEKKAAAEAKAKEGSGAEKAK
ncbi:MULTISPECIES: HvfA family oxazolone/thioamide-modified RiPP metallophore [Methylotenera]|uniref:HvfA family oxazolone/thioamide-modified RiPP metallophore n=1 Tax=Methylotenera TaxID=359407 RepID=UPI00036C4818|nr:MULTISPECIES: hypothetical protein [Methylotenera]